MKKELLLKYCIAINESMMENAPQRILYISPIEVNEIYAFLTEGKYKIEFPAPCNLEHKERVDARFLARLLIDKIKENNNDKL